MDVEGPFVAQDHNLIPCLDQTVVLTDLDQGNDLITVADGRAQISPQAGRVLCGLVDLTPRPLHRVIHRWVATGRLTRL